MTIEVSEENAEPLTWIYLAGSAEELNEMMLGQPSGVRIDGLPLVEARGGESLRKSLNEFLGLPLTEETLQKVGREIHEYYIRENRPILLVHLLEYDAEGGGVGFMVREGSLGEVQVKGARWFDEDRIARQVRLEPGGPIDREVLVKDLDWLNQNPFLNIDVLFTPGAEPLSSDLILETTDRFPLRVYGGVENTGTESIGVWRGYLGVQWGDAFGLGQQLAYEFSSAFADFDAQQVHALTWKIPLPWRHNLNWYLSYGDSFFTLGPEASFGGDSWQISPRYEFPLPSPTVGWTQVMELGFDVKSADFGINFDGGRIPTNQTDIVQLVLEYSTALTDSHGITSGTLGALYSPGGLTNNNVDSAFQDVDPRADSEYVYFTGSLRRTQWLPGETSLIFSVTGQYAPDVLLNTEDLGIGGYSTVRGYEERILFGDTGAFGGIEFRSPNYSNLLGGAGENAVLQGLVFVDGGWVDQNELIERSDQDQYLLSVGAGLRMELAPYASLRVDYGYPLETSEEWVSSSGRFHLGLVVGF